MARSPASFGWTLAAVVVVAGAVGSLVPLDADVSAQSPIVVINNTTTTSPCPNNCCGHGECIEPPVNTTATAFCSCFPGFFSEDCGFADSNGTARSCCPEGCVNGVCVGEGSCQCSPGWTGPRCDVPACPNDCSGNGICQGGACSCNPGFTGLDCSQPVVTCPNDCGGNGACVGGVCQCNAGFTGEDCRYPAGMTCPNSCSGNGFCVEIISSSITSDRCLCRDGFTGDDCSLETCQQDADCQHSDNPCITSTCSVLSGTCSTVFVSSSVCYTFVAPESFACFTATDETKVGKPAPFFFSTSLYSSIIQLSKAKQLCEGTLPGGDSVFLKMYGAAPVKGEPKFEPIKVNVTATNPMFQPETLKLNKLTSLLTSVFR
jgi:hypothetical protein